VRALTGLGPPPLRQCPYGTRGESADPDTLGKRTLARKALSSIALRVAQEQLLAHRCAPPMTPPPSPRRGKASRPPHLPLADLETILGDVSDMLGRVPDATGARALDDRVVQCRAAIAACRRHEFSPPLLRALSAKVLEVETDALVLRRSVRLPEREIVFVEGAAAAKRTRKERRRRDST
jgi:hypothetical protein